MSVTPRVAVLLATCNGAEFIAQQLESLRANHTAFTLYWLDDHSADDTRERFRSAAGALELDLKELQFPQRLRIPAAYFQLIESVTADIYLFCDQDDLWQPGKIDATVAHLLPNLAAPALCYSDPLIFSGTRVDVLKSHAEVRGIHLARVAESSTFTFCPAFGHTIGFTRPLREIFLKHAPVARDHALMHDWWLYLIARASGATDLLLDGPTTLYRQHGKNAVGVSGRRREMSRWGVNYGLHMWRRCQAARRMLAKQAQGFLLAVPTLPPGPRRDRIAALARLVVGLPERHTPAACFNLLRNRVMASAETAFWMTVTCLCGTAPLDPGWRRPWDPPTAPAQRSRRQA